MKHQEQEPAKTTDHKKGPLRHQHTGRTETPTIK